MALTPLDIRRNEFARALRGYSREEVDSFLAMVADEFENLVGENRDTERRLSELEKEVAEYRDLERTLMDTLVTAQKASDERKESTERESELIKREAKVRAEQSLENARIEAERLLMEARRQAHAAIEDARQKAHETIETAKKRADELYVAAKNDATALEQQTAALTARRDAFLKNFTAFLQGQMEALSLLEAEPAPVPAPRPPSRMETLSKDDAEALVELDRELAEFDAETAQGLVTENAPPSDEDGGNGTEDEAPAGGKKRKQKRTEGEEVLVEGRSGKS